jgi:hypothetical protein
MIKRYFVRYFIETPNAISNRLEIENGKFSNWKFNLGNTEIILYDDKQGLHADLYLDAESLEKGEEKSKMFIENILNLIDFSTSSASSISLFISIYDASLGLKERDCKQVFYQPILERNISIVDKDIFSDIFNAFNKNNDERVVRAISWLRKGYLEQKHVDKFIAFWTGLESINELLGDYFKIPAEKRRMKCRKCGTTLYTISAGVERLFVDKVKVEKVIFTKIRKARGKLLHGGGPLGDNFVNEIKDYNPKIRKALLLGIGGLLQISDNTIENIIKKKSKAYNEKIRIIIKAKLTNFNPPDLKEFNAQPRFDLIENNLLKREVPINGKLVLTINPKFKKVNATFKDEKVEMWGDDDTSIESIRINK